MTSAVRFAALLLVAAALLAGCTATPEAPRSADAMAKEFDSAPNAAIVYLYRSDLAGGTGTADLWLNGRLIGQTLPKTYFRTAVRAGRNLLAAGGRDSGRLEFDTRSGEVYYIAIAVDGIDEAYLSRFTLTPAATAQRELLRCCTLLENWSPGQTRWQF